MLPSVKTLVLCVRVSQTQACKSLDQLVILSEAEASGLLDTVEHAIQVLREVAGECNPQNTDDRGADFLSFSNVVVINSLGVTETSPSSSSPIQQLLSEMERTMDIQTQQRLHLYFLHLHASLTPHRGSPFLNSRVVTELFACDQDFEWVLSRVLHRTSRVACRNAQLRLVVVGTGGQLALDGNSNTRNSDGADAFALQKSGSANVRYGLCDQDEALVLSGTFSVASGTREITGGSKSVRTPFVELIFQYEALNAELHVARTAIRLRDDLTDEMHIARVERNRALCVRHDGNSMLLLEQRRQLMDEKAQFHHTLTLHEVAESESAFKRLNIMKEELWARRRWILQRGLRVFEEDELAAMAQEALASAATFHERLERLQVTYTVNARENSRGGTGDSSASRVRAEQYLADLRTSSSRSSLKEANADDEDSAEEASEELVQRCEKLTLKVDLLTTQFHNLESRMEDLIHSVRVAQTKGVVIMSDTLKAWLVLYHDLMDSKHKVLAVTRQKTQTEQQLQFLEHKQATEERMRTEIHKSINASLGRCEKEHAKRKKRTFLCMKAMLSAITHEFEASAACEAARRTETQCKLMRSPPLDATLLGSCVHVFFPLDISQEEVPSGRAPHLRNAVHALLFGLRNFCVEATQEPFCKRLSLQENFLWLDQEQLIRVANEKQDALLGGGQEDNGASLAEQMDATRKRIQQECWAVVVVTYNAMFSSPTAVRELKRVLLFAEQARKQVLHVEVETPFANLDEFKVFWHSQDSTTDRSSKTPSGHSVEKEYLTWKQNLGFFQTAMRSLSNTTTSQGGSVLKFAPVVRECTACANSHSESPLHLLPCMPCCWPSIARSAHNFPATASPSDSQEAGHQRAFLGIVKAVGEWIDGLALSATTTQTAVRSHNLDPRSASPLSLALELFWSEQQKLRSAQWEEAFARRKQEMQRQIGKLFKVYEEEASELVHLQYVFGRRKQALIASCEERDREFQDEQKLVRTMVELKRSEDATEASLRAQETARMIEEELTQVLNQTDLLAMQLDKLEDEEVAAEGDSDIQAVEAARDAFHRSLRLCCHRILELGKLRVENQLSLVTKQFGVQDTLDQIDHLEFRSQFEQVQQCSCVLPFPSFDSLYCATRTR